MSLYDTIQSDYPLPDPELQNVEFQSKDLEEMLQRYRITADGRLWRLRWGVHLFGEAERPAHHDALEEDTHYHGDISFHADTSKGWVEYRARFTHGTVEWIRRVEEEVARVYPTDKIKSPVHLSIGQEAVSVGEASAFVDSLERLARDAQDLEQERAMGLEELLTRLERLDPEVAQRAIHVFDNRYDAALWLISVHPALGKWSPYKELARGRRQAVLEALGQLESGVSS